MTEINTAAFTMPNHEHAIEFATRHMSRQYGGYLEVVPYAASPVRPFKIPLELVMDEAFDLNYLRRIIRHRFEAE